MQILNTLPKKFYFYILNIGYNSNNKHLKMLKKDLSCISEEPGYNKRFYIISLLSAFMIGTKMIMISLAKWDKTWIFFLEHMAIWITCVLYSFLTTGFSSLKLTGVFKYNIYICAFFSGSADAIGDVFFIFALKHALNSGTSPAAITTVLMFNVFIVLIAGIAIFKERHEKMKYFGAAIVFISLMVISSQREFEAQVEVSEYQNDSYTLAMFWVVFTTIFWGLCNILGKYASYFYDADPTQFSVVSGTWSGLIGSWSIIIIITNSIPFELEEGSNIYLWILYWLMSGFFTAWSLFCFYKALSLGSSEITQLIINTKILFQVIEEIILFSVLPSLIACLGMAGVWIGVVIMMFTKERRNLRYDPIKPDNYYVSLESHLNTN